MRNDNDCLDEYRRGDIVTLKSDSDKEEFSVLGKFWADSEKLQITNSTLTGVLIVLPDDIEHVERTDEFNESRDYANLRNGG